MKTGLLILVAALALLTSSWAQSGDSRFVQVMNVRVRQEPSFLSRTLEILSYGDQVTRLQQKSTGQWVHILTRAGEQGWLHQSALTSTQLVLKPGEQSAQVGASRAEPTLAGKGFTRETEEDYKKKNQALPFDLLDQLEEDQPDDAEIEAFARNGRLSL